jgi:hypothetical protein
MGFSPLQLNPVYPAILRNCYTPLPLSNHQQAGSNIAIPPLFKLSKLLMEPAVARRTLAFTNDY